MKKEPGDIIILHMCIINDNHMMYGSRDMEHDGHRHFVGWNFQNILHRMSYKRSK